MTNNSTIYLYSNCSLDTPLMVYKSERSRLFVGIEWTKCPFEVRELIHQNQLAATNFNICCPIDTPWMVYGWCMDSVLKPFLQHLLISTKTDLYLPNK